MQGEDPKATSFGRWLDYRDILEANGNLRDIRYETKRRDNEMLNKEPLRFFVTNYKMFIYRGRQSPELDRVCDEVEYYWERFVDPPDVQGPEDEESETGMSREEEDEDGEEDEDVDEGNKVNFMRMDLDEDDEDGDEDYMWQV